MTAFMLFWILFGFILGVFCIAALITIAANQLKRWLKL